MAGIFDEVMDGIAAKDKQAPGAAPPATQTQTTPPPAVQTPPPAHDKKGIFEYGEEFAKRYGEPKKPA
jgi:hypothetical protein